MPLLIPCKRIGQVHSNLFSYLRYRKNALRSKPVLSQTPMHAPDLFRRLSVIQLALSKVDWFVS